MKIKRYPGGIVHLKFKTQNKLARAFIRIQEFYESPYPTIRRKYFTVEQFAVLYTKTFKSFSYFTDWHGFNIPGKVVQQFAKVFKNDLTPQEKKIITLKPQYIIGTWNDIDTPHELCHAKFGLNKKYRKLVQKSVKWFIQEYPVEANTFKKLLLDVGYSKLLLVDELNAYLLTNELSDFLEDFKPRMANRLWKAAQVYRTTRGLL